MPGMRRKVTFIKLKFSRIERRRRRREEKRATARLVFLQQQQSERDYIFVSLAHLHQFVRHCNTLDRL
jgi:hypothetical protein